MGSPEIWVKVRSSGVQALLAGKACTPKHHRTITILIGTSPLFQDYPIMNCGQWAESFACDYLRTQGLSILERNYHCRYGEIDLVMQHQDILVFVEVRYRSYQKYGGSRESIDYRKQQRLLATANHYLQTHSCARTSRCRFDVVLMSGQKDSPCLQWITDAFRA